MLDCFDLKKTTRFIFVDCENIDYKKVAKYLLDNNCTTDNGCKIFCLIGANSNQDNFASGLDSLLGNKKENFSIEKERTEQTGPNALDFILTAYIGMALEREPDAQFVILSGDSDYKCVINHFSKKGLKLESQNIKTKKNVSKETNKDSNKHYQIDFPKIKEKVLKIISKIKKKRRPKRKDKFFNFFRNAVKKYSENPDDCLEKILKDFEEEGIIVCEKNKIEWK